MTREEAINVLEQLMGIQIGHFTDAEMLTALDMAVDAIRWNPNWISVEDELPEEENLYIVSNGKETSVAYWVEDEWYSFGSVITYWMPLPSAPRKEE